MAREISNLIGWWQLNGNALDNSEIVNDGIWTGTENYVEGHIKNTQAGDFDGSSYVGIGATLGLADDFSISFWFRSNSNEYSHILKDSKNTNTLNDGWGFYRFTDGKLYFRTWSGTFKAVSTDISINTWTHIFGIVENNIMYLYKDNILINQITMAGDVSYSSSVLDIGFWYNTFFDGQIQDVRVYNRVLTDNERQSIYRYGLGVIENYHRVIAKETVNVLNTKIEEIDARGANKAEVEMTYNTDVIDNDRFDYINRNNDLFFVGNVKNVGRFGSKVVTAYDLSYSNKIVNNIYNGLAPEVILQHLVENFTDMTWGGGFASGFIIDVQPFLDTDVMDAIRQILDVLESDYAVDFDGVFTYFKSGSTTSSFIANVKKTGTNFILNEDGWNSNAEDKASKIILIGNKDTYNKTDSFTATGGQTEFILTYKPEGTVKLLKNGVELDPQVEGSTTGDYRVEPGNQKIILLTGATGGDAIVASYNYQLDIRVEIEIDNDADNERLFNKKYINSYAEGRKLARTLADFYGESALRAKGTIPNTDEFLNIKPNYRLQGKDELRDVNAFFIVNKVVYEFPKNGLQIELGPNEYDLFDWSKETQQRIKDLEAANQNNAILQRYRYILEEIKVSVVELSVNVTVEPIGDAFIWDHPDNGIWDDYNWS